MSKQARTAIAVCIATLACGAVWAQPAGTAPSAGQGTQKPAPDPAKFAAYKAEILKGHEARIQVLQQSTSCIQAAKDFDALRACREKERQALSALRDQVREEHRAGRGAPPAGSPARQ